MFSSFQIERLIRAFRALQGLPPPPPGSAGDRVDLTETGRGMAKTQPPLPGREQKIHPQTMIRELTETKTRPPGVELELERRAASFMDPKPPLENPPRIPKLSRVNGRKKTNGGKQKKTGVA
ncbi:MAG: hypothetical protein OEW12_08280 [Deltaproteobacteria bacterium]|nr:hypothetical protein [Deltaproteobacteria bacterium]